MTVTTEPPSPLADPDLPENRFALEALERHKHEGMELAVRARTIAMLVVGVMISFITPWPEVIFYHVILGLFILIGLAQRRVGRVGSSGPELFLLFCDLVLMTVVAVLPNPFGERTLPLAFQLHFEIHKYFFIILVTATLSYSWRTLVAVGTWTTALWLGAVAAVWYVSEPDPAVFAAIAAFYPDATVVPYLSNPTQVALDQQIQSAVVFLMCALILALSMRRFQNLVLAQAEVERERANLARYFSPNVVDQLSHNDDPLKKVSTQDIAVMFVDIVGFTQYSAARDPQEVITTLRAFHGIMETEVFKHNGTLDKYLGDGLMATFGTPMATPSDADNALACARAMIRAVDAWNAERAAAGEPEIKASVGVHYGPAVLGDIGANRLEYAVLGNTVNVASRLEAMTRDLDARLVVSDELLSHSEQHAPPDLTCHTNRPVRGLDHPMTVWAMPC